MRDIKFATYPYTPIKNIKDDKRQQYIYMELMKIKLYLIKTGHIFQIIHIGY